MNVRPTFSRRDFCFRVFIVAGWRPTTNLTPRRGVGPLFRRPNAPILADRIQPHQSGRSDAGPWYRTRGIWPRIAHGMRLLLDATRVRFHAVEESLGPIQFVARIKWAHVDVLIRTLCAICRTTLMAPSLCAQQRPVLQCGVLSVKAFPYIKTCYLAPQA